MATFDPLNPLQDVTPRFTEEQLQNIVQWFDEKSKPLLVINQEEPSHAITQNKIHIQDSERVRECEQTVKGKATVFRFHRRSFHYPDYAEIMREVGLLRMDMLNLLNKDQFIYILDKFILEPDMKHELKLAFKVFDLEDRDFLEYEELRHIVTTYGSPFDAAELTEFMREANVRGLGNIVYNDFAEDIFNLSPNLYKNVPKNYLHDDADQDPSVPSMIPEEVHYEEDPIAGPAPSPESFAPEITGLELLLDDTPSSIKVLEPQVEATEFDQTTQPPSDTATQTMNSSSVASTPKSEPKQPAPQTT